MGAVMAESSNQPGNLIRRVYYRLCSTDRLCLALGARLHATIFTADQAWGTNGRIRQIH